MKRTASRFTHGHGIMHQCYTQDCETDTRQRHDDAGVMSDCASE